VPVEEIVCVTVIAPVLDCVLVLLWLWLWLWLGELLAVSVNVVVML